MKSYTGFFIWYYRSPRSSICSTPKVLLKLQSYKQLTFSDPGTRDKASATTFSRPLMCSMSKLNYDKNSSQRAFLRDTVALLRM